MKWQVLVLLVGEQNRYCHGSVMKQREIVPGKSCPVGSTGGGSYIFNHRHSINIIII